MKTLRLFTIALLAVLVMSTWAPFPAYAQPSTTGTVNATVKLAKLRVNNRTGGTLYVKFTSATNNYYFSAPNQGTTTFTSPTIKPGKYTIIITASACRGKVTLHKKVNGGTVSLPKMFCGKR